MFCLSESACRELTSNMKGITGVARSPKYRRLTQVKERARYSHKKSQVAPQNGGELGAAWPLPAHEDVALTR